MTRVMRINAYGYMQMSAPVAVTAVALLTAGRWPEADLDCSRAC